jgi:C4-dicarboxylate transporter DctQ subunit
MSSQTPRSRSFGDRIEENLIAFFLGAMTIITVANVVARFRDSNILWALEATVFLFAFLVLIGASYAVKHTFHIGVDVVVRLLPRPRRRVVTLLAIAACLTFSLLLLKGSWDYWWAFATKRAFYEVNDIPMPGFLQFFAHWLNDGELYEKMPRFIPYAVLPISMLLLTIRFLQVGVRVWRGEQDLIIESHEVEEIYADNESSESRVSQDAER